MTDQATDLTPDLRAANSVANQANAVTAIYGITGSGKSALCDTAAEYCWETFSRTTLCYANDPGGWGNKRISLIRLGIMRVWDPTNHVNPFETMELISLGAWPAEILDPDRGYADPSVPLVLPRQLAHILICPQGHEAARYEHEAILQTSSAVCPTCGVLTSLANALRVDKMIVKSKIFSRVGLRIYDSVTGMNDRGLLIELPAASARGDLPAGREGGSPLGSADALRSGRFSFGTGSKAQVGFMQNRSYQWLVNIRQIPDQVVPAIATFGVEQSKVDDESGGEMVLGPKISGNARTSAVPGWVGNCTHASKEPDEHGRMRHRLWLTNHIDPRRPDRIPYLAKHRGTPLGMPDYLEDPWDDDPLKRQDLAWTGCSLKVFFKLLEKQLTEVMRRDAEKYPDAPALQKDQAEPEDELIPVAAGAVTSTNAPIPITGGAKIGRRPGGARRPGVVAVAMPPAASSPSIPVQSAGAVPLVPASSGPTVPASAGPVTSSGTMEGSQSATEAPSVITQQLQASLEAAGVGATRPAATVSSTEVSMRPQPAASTTLASMWQHGAPASVAPVTGDQLGHAPVTPSLANGVTPAPAVAGSRAPAAAPSVATATGPPPAAGVGVVTTPAVPSQAPASTVAAPTPTPAVGGGQAHHLAPAPSTHPRSRRVPRHPNDRPPIG